MVTMRDLAELLRKLEAIGIRVEVGERGEIALAGDAEPPAELLATIRAHRGGLGMALARRRALQARVVAAGVAAAPRVAPAHWLQEVAAAHQALDLYPLEVLAVRFERWARGELRGDEPAWSSMRAAQLGGAEVLVVLDEAVRVPPELERLPTYTSAEVRRLVGADPRILRAVHLTKEVWPAARLERVGAVGEEE